jgi:ubiquinone/menaquinone biosynthesis C-methylase UbiE
MAEKAYNALADWFEYLNDDCGYEEWSQYLLSTLQKHGAGATGLDIGCGGGYFSRKLYKAGYQMTGVDVSAAMLSKAQELARKEGCNIPYIQQDVTSLQGLKNFSFAVAINDCFNYIPKNKLRTAFKKVNGALQKGGLFFFDISSESKLKNLPPFSIDDREEVTYFSFNKQEGDTVWMDVSLFIKKSGNEYVRRDETHTQYIYTREEIETALQETGFALIECSGHLGGAVSTEGAGGANGAGGDRIEFLARRM